MVVVPLEGLIGQIAAIATDPILIGLALLGAAVAVTVRQFWLVWVATTFLVQVGFVVTTHSLRMSVGVARESLAEDFFYAFFPQRAFVVLVVMAICWGLVNLIRWKQAS